MKPSDMTEISLPDSGKSSISVIDALNFKHPDPCIPPDFALPSFTTLPSLEKAEVTSAHVQSVTHHLQGGLALVAVMLPTGVTYYFTMVPPVFVYMILLLVFVVSYVILLFPGMMLGLCLLVT